MRSCGRVEPAWRRGVALAVCAALLLLAGCTSTTPEAERPGPPDREELAAAIAAFGKAFYNFDELRAVVVATDHDIVFEQYFQTDDRAYWGMQSVTKSVISTLVGIAMGEGLIGSVNDTLGTLLPRHRAAMSPRTASITLEQLLTMTAGLPSGEKVTGPSFVQSEDWVRHILSRPGSTPGQRFVYSNATSHLLSAILTEATGTSALQYARSRLFGPLGIDTTPALVRTDPGLSQRQVAEQYDRAGFAWPVDPQGVNTGWWGLRLRPRDMVRLGQLFLAGGVWDGERVVPAEWIEEATRQHVVTNGLLEGYGYHWWTQQGEGGARYHAIGYGGQHIAVMPARELVVVTATEVRQADVSSQGIDNQVLIGMIDHIIASRFPA